MTPTYVAKRIGDEYVMIRVDTEGVIQRAGLAGLGLGLIGFGLMRRGFLGMISCAAGSALTYSGWTGRSIMPECHKSAKSPSYPRSVMSSPSDEPAKPGSTDALDEALMESFPASDPPAASGNR